MKQTLKAEGISTTFRKLYNLPTLNNWIIAASFANILFRLYVINKYYNSVYISSTFIMLSNFNYYTWIICRTKSGNNFKIKLTQRRLIGVIPRFCDANWSGVIRAHPYTTPNKGFQVCPENTIEIPLITPDESASHNLGIISINRHCVILILKLYNLTISFPEQF